MCIELPSDATPAMAYGFEVKARYSFVGATPVPVWQINTGSEGTPNWVTIAAGSGNYGIIHCRAGSGGSGDGHYYADIPESGVKLTEEGYAAKSTTPS